MTNKKIWGLKMWTSALTQTSHETDFRRYCTVQLHVVESNHLCAVVDGSELQSHSRKLQYRMVKVKTHRD